MDTSKKITILYVEDEEDLREVYSENWEAEGFTVHQAPDGLAALKLLEDHSVDVIISDIQMPNCDGITFLKKLLEKYGETAPPVFFTTGYADVNETQAKKMGAAGYLSKPFSTEVLTAMIHERLANSAGTESHLSSEEIPDPIYVFHAEDSDTDFDLLKAAVGKCTREHCYKIERFINGSCLISKIEALLASNTPQLPHVIILDINMPGISGLEALKKIRSHVQFTNTSIIVLTSSDAPRDRKKAQELGADTYYTKPHTFEGWKHMVQSWKQSWIKRNRRKDYAQTG